MSLAAARSLQRGTDPERTQERKVAHYAFGRDSVAENLAQIMIARLPPSVDFEIILTGACHVDLIDIALMTPRVGRTRGPGIQAKLERSHRLI